jgi:decaprenylphospho-beta-D-erythro-pentofuranosid-2-ulose 2-reductase
MVVRPGFVHTRMTAGLPPAPMSTTPDAVAAAIESGLRRRAEVLWVPGTLRPVMAAVRLLPRRVFRSITL